MANQENRYARFPVSFYVGDKQYSNDSLVSVFGARRVFEADEVARRYGDLTGKEVTVNFRGLTISGTFTKEVLPQSSFYNIRFNEVDTDQRKQLESDIAAHGFPSPWKRGFPRISSDTSVESVEVPSMCIVDDENGVHYFRTLNFTLGGLLLQTEASTANHFKLNEKFYLQIILNSGNTISGIWAMIVRKDVERRLDELTTNCGVQIVSMSAEANKRYRKLILNYCEKMKDLYNV